MLDLSPEIERLRPHLGGLLTDDLIARERRQVFSIYPEVRLAAWAGALLIATAAGIFIRNHFERLDRVAVAVVVGIAAAVCYAIAWRSRGLVSEYVLLLAALLVSADVGFIEQQFDLFGESGARHLLLLAIFHGLTAYRFDSRLVLSVSLASLAAWMGLDSNLSRDTGELAIRAFACAVVVLIWRALNRRPEFHRVLEHFAATLALTGGLLLVDHNVYLGAPVTTALAIAVIAWGFRTRAEAFVLYAFVAAVIANTALAMKFGDEELVVLIAIVIAIPSLVMLHRQFSVSSRAKSRDLPRLEEESSHRRGSLDFARDDTERRGDA